MAWKSEIERYRMLVISLFREYQKYVTKKISLKRNDLAARIAERVLIVHASEGEACRANREVGEREYPH